MHDRLIRLVLEVAVPAGTELLHVILSQLLLGGSNLHASLNTIGSQWSGSIDIPFVLELLLHLRIIPDEVIEALSVRLGTISRECGVVVLEV